MKIHSKIPLPSEVMEHFGRILSISFKIVKANIYIIYFSKIYVMQNINSESKLYIFFFIIYQFIISKIGYNLSYSLYFQSSTFQSISCNQTYMGQELKSIDYYLFSITIRYPRYFITFLYCDCFTTVLLNIFNP